MSCSFHSSFLSISLQIRLYQFLGVLVVTCHANAKWHKPVFAVVVLHKFCFGNKENPAVKTHLHRLPAGIGNKAPHYPVHSLILTLVFPTHFQQLDFYTFPPRFFMFYQRHKPQNILATPQHKFKDAAFCLLPVKQKPLAALHPQQVCSRDGQDNSLQFRPRFNIEYFHKPPCVALISEESPLISKYTKTMTKKVNDLQIL